MGTLRTSYRRFGRDAGALPIQVTDDDLEILRRVFRHRFVRADDLYRLFPERSPDRLSRRLTQLYRNHLLDRPLAQINRYRAGGSKALVYGLDTAGARLLADRFGYSMGSGEWKARNRTFTRENLDHTLAVTRFLVDLELECRGREAIEVLSFEDILVGAPEATRLSAQPGRWSVPVSWSGLSGSVTVIPDAIFGLRRTDEAGQSARTFAFLEVDRGTMTIVPAKRVRESEAFLYRATILRKLLTYAESHRQRLHTRLGIPIARVLTVTTTPARAEAMRQAAERFIVKPMGLPAGLFLFGSISGKDCGLLGQKWMDAAGAPISLVPASTRSPIS